MFWVGGGRFVSRTAALRFAKTPRQVDGGDCLLLEPCTGERRRVYAAPPLIGLVPTGGSGPSFRELWNELLRQLRTNSQETDVVGEHNSSVLFGVSERVHDLGGFKHSDSLGRGRPRAVE